MYWVGIQGKSSPEQKPRAALRRWQKEHVSVHWQKCMKSRFGVRGFSTLPCNKQRLAASRRNKLVWKQAVMHGQAQVPQRAIHAAGGDAASGGSLALVEMA
jgi:hypothetical protein